MTVEHLTEKSLLYTALQALLHRYLELVNCGDCGNWDPEQEPDVIQAHAALRTVRDAVEVISGATHED